MCVECPLFKINFVDSNPNVPRSSRVPARARGETSSPRARARSRNQMYGESHVCVFVSRRLLPEEGNVRFPSPGDEPAISLQYKLLDATLCESRPLRTNRYFVRPIPYARIEQYCNPVEKLPPISALRVGLATR